MRYYYDNRPLKLLCSDMEVKNIVKTFISEHKGKSFTFSELSQFLIDFADENHLLDKEEDTTYNGIILTDFDGKRLSLILGEFLLEGKVFINFYRNPFCNISNEDTIFIVKS